MKLTVLYRPQSEFARIVEEFVRDFERTRHQSVKLVSLDTREGADMARLYDVVQYPAIMATQDDGRLLKVWQGETLPLMDEVAGYLDH